MAEPIVIQKRAIDVTPHNHALWCSVEGLNRGEPFANTIQNRQWSEDGKEIVFLLDTHSAFFVRPNETVAVVEITPDVSGELLSTWQEKDLATIKDRPVPMVKCPHCKGKGKIVNKGTEKP